MRRLIVCTVLFAIMVISLHAQDVGEKVTRKKTTRVRPAQCPAAYITTSTGLNNNTGIVGFSFEVPLSKYVCIEGGPGNGTWDYKVYMGCKYYFNPCQRGLAIGTGLTYCGGLRDDQKNLQTVYGYTEPIQYNKNPQTNMFFTAYKYWNMGKKYNRLYAELGWSVPLTGGDKMTQLTGARITDRQRNNIDSWAPGGLVLAVGVSFGMH